MSSFDRFNEGEWPARKYFFSSIKKNEKLGMMVKYQTVAKVLKIIWLIKEIWDKFEM